MAAQNTSEGSARGKSSRLNIVLSARDRERIDRLVEMMEAETVTEVTKDAFRLLEYFLKSAERGEKLYLQDQNGDMTKLEIFGITTSA